MQRYNFSADPQQPAFMIKIAVTRHDLCKMGTEDKVALLKPGISFRCRSISLATPDISTDSTFHPSVGRQVLLEPMQRYNFSLEPYQPAVMSKIAIIRHYFCKKAIEDKAALLKLGQDSRLRDCWVQFEPTFTSTLVKVLRPQISHSQPVSSKPPSSPDAGTFSAWSPGKLI